MTELRGVASWYSVRSPFRRSVLPPRPPFSWNGAAGEDDGVVVREMLEAVACMGK